ncbi:hypothetical protein Angca_004834, partial [Angiostrongylus cantonensis]
QEKVMVTAQWFAAGLIHHSSPNLDDTITAEQDYQQIDEIHRELQQERKALVSRKGSILLHDNAMPQIAKLALQKLNELGYETLPRPLYSPDLSPTDYHFLKHLDNFMRKKCFTDYNDAKYDFNFNFKFIAFRTPRFYASGIMLLIGR